MVRQARGLTAIYLPAYCQASGLDAHGPMVMIRSGLEPQPLVKVCTDLDPRPAPVDRVVLVADPDRLARPIRAYEAYDPLLFRMAHAIGCGFAWNRPPTESYLEALSRPLAEHLARYYAPRARERERQGLSESRLAKALAMIESRLTDGLSIEELAEAVHLSTFHFCHMFKRSTGLPPAAYMARRRVEAAAELLAGTSLSMAEIALRMGYRTQAHFCTVFRRVTGTTPTQHRLASRAGGPFRPQ